MKHIKSPFGFDEDTMKSKISRFIIPYFLPVVNMKLFIGHVNNSEFIKAKTPFTAITYLENQKTS